MKHKLTLLVLLLTVGFWTIGYAQSANLPGPATGGNQDCVQVSTVPITNTFTVEAWIYPTQLTGGHADYATYGFSVMASSGVVNAYPLWVTVYGSQVRVWTWEATATAYHQTTNAGLTVNTWHHIAVTATKGGNTTVYVDGVNRLSYTNDGETAWSTSFTIGALRPTRSKTNLAFVGLIDEVRVWNDIRTPLELTTNMFNELNTANPTAMQGIAGYWTFNGNANDTSGNNLTTALTNGAQVNGSQCPLVGSPITLPVELSSFTAITSSSYFVQLNWVTQSETGVSGFRIYRGTTMDLSQATNLNVFINASNTASAQSYMYVDNDIYENGTYYYWLQNIDLDGSTDFYGPVAANVMVGENNEIPPVDVVTGITKVFPNPFNPNTNIQFGLSTAAQVNVSVYNVRGQLVSNLMSAAKEPGYHTVTWNGTDKTGKICSSGIYTVLVKIGDEKYSRQMIMSK
ncbi:MAG TPA: FlgD immunoglobulin-like domain containing protein [Candidatus Cloacimonadota bacterium]|nr:FlgD immunoglobulin-like domain containing protein [Candidatus Cloacimonadota bacterium]